MATQNTANRNTSKAIEVSWREVGADKSTSTTATFEDSYLGRSKMQHALREAVLNSSRNDRGMPVGITVSPGKDISNQARAAAKNSLSSMNFGYINRNEFRELLWKEAQQNNPRANRMYFDNDSKNFDTAYKKAVNEKARQDLEEIKELVNRGAKPPVIKLSLVEVDEEITKELGELITDPTLKAMGSSLDVRIVTKNTRDKAAILEKFGDRFATRETKEVRLAAFKDKVKNSNIERFEEQYQRNFSYLKPWTWLRPWKLPWNKEQIHKNPDKGLKPYSVLEQVARKVSANISKLKQEESREVKFGTLPELLASLSEIYELSKKEKFKDLKFELDKSVMVLKSYGIPVEAGKKYYARSLGPVLEHFRAKKLIPPVAVQEYRKMRNNPGARWRGTPSGIGTTIEQDIGNDSAKPRWLARWVARNFPNLNGPDSRD